MSQIGSLIKYESSKGFFTNTISETKPKMVKRYCLSFREI